MMKNMKKVLLRIFSKRNLMKFDLTKEEKNAINTLKRLAKRWPESLWLFSTGGDLSVMKYEADIDKAFTTRGSYNQDYQVASVDIPNDGGDW